MKKNRQNQILLIHKHEPLIYAIRLILIASFILFPFLQFTAAARPGKKVVLQLKRKHQFQFAGYYAAIEKGYYSDEGLDVEVREYQPGTSVVDEVVTGKADFGISNSNILIHYINGAPVVVLASIFQTSPSALIARSENNITSPRDIAGKTIEINTKSSGSVEILAMLGLEGIKPSQYQVIEASQSLNKLLNHQTDASEIYLTNEPYFLDKFGIPYTIINPKRYGIDFYAECLFTRQELVRKNPKLVESFLNASLKGWEYALANPEEVAQIIQSKYKTTKTLDHLIYEAQRTKDFVLPNVVNIGHTNRGRWMQIMEILLQSGLINKTKPLDNFIYKLQKVVYTPIPSGWYYSLLALIVVGLILFHFWFNKRNGSKRQIIINELKQQIDGQKNELHHLNSQIEELIQRNNDLESFKESLLSNLSFEIRTPLNNIIGYSELLNDPKIRPTQALQFTKEINKSCRLLQNQIDNLVDLSKLESNQFQLVYQRINLFELMNTLQVILFNEIKLFDKEHIAIKSFIDENEIDFDILSDRNLFKSIFQRLINNAVKYTSKGYIEIGIKKAEKVNYLHFWIQDSGIGIDSEKAKTIFDKSELDEQSDGFGILHLGLPVVKRIVELLNGKIWLETAEGTGTTVNIEIPYTPINSSKSKPKQKASPFYIHQEPPKLTGKKILIVEDIQSNFILLNKLLDETGCTITHARTGEEAIKVFNEQPDFDLILMDLRLADMDGIEITRNIRSKSTKVVIVAQTAYSSGVKVNSSINAGCNDFITKPISRVDLYNILRKYLLREEYPG